MKAKKEAPKDSKKRQPPIKIPLPFDQAMKGLLGLSPEDAKDAREKGDGRTKRKR
jgi:hypothetical protein